ncbi:galactitol-1-phosphate 5-dehydrogenase [Clostridium sediminicola]|uniref:zinc-dependent alcohol dehydrogenase n=1 Tax=Clostridium sediminicola TaxID=3114879 RepID=UPI0031F23B7F
MKSRQVVLTAPRKIEVIEVDLKPGPNEVLVKTYMSSICGTDKNYFRGQMPNKTIVKDPSGGNDEAFFEFPLPMGHEGAGVVVEVGEGVTEFKVGDKVTSFAWFNTMADYFIAPVKYDGAYSGTGLMKVPDGMDMTDAAMAETTCCPIYAGMESGVEVGDDVLIVGTGFAGQIIAQMARRMGAGKIICVDPISRKRKLAKDLGADIVLNNTDDVEKIVLEETNGYGVDVAFEVAGYTEEWGSESLVRVTNLVKHGGIIGLYSWILDDVTFNMDRWHNDGLDIRTLALMHSVRHNRFWYNEKTMKILKDGYVKVKPLITDVFNLDDAQKAFEAACDTDETCKVAFKFE